MPLDWLRCFDVVLRAIHRKNDKCLTDYIGIVFPTPNLEFSSYSEVLHGNTGFKLMKG